MRLTAFRVQMFKCVIDSNWIAVTPLTVLVGKNESGKTALLKALHKFNPFNPEPYATREWPRGHRDTQSTEQVVCVAEFELSPAEVAELRALTNLPALPGTLHVTKDYAGKFEVLFPTEVFPDKLHPNEADRLGGSLLEPPQPTLLASPTLQQRAHEYVISHLPTFVYLDEYGIFKGYASLNQVKQRKDQGTLTGEDKTFLTILEQAGLDLEREVEKAGTASREDRQYDLGDAAATLTRKISAHWKALRYEVDFRGDAYEFFTFVKSEKDRALIRLEERSRGFQWFFSFDLMLMHETKGTLKNCVILLDEPALHLHPQAQRDLLERLEKYAEGNTLIYTTHLPFMIDLRHPERIRVISETEQGSVVSEDLTKSQPEAKLVLQAALGIGGRLSCPVAARNLVVEGADDWWLVTALSNLLIRSGRTGLPSDVMISAAGGVSEVTYLATFMTGQGLEVVALYDSDAAGDASKDELIKSWLARYKGSHAAAVSLGPAIGVPGREVSIEDLFAEDVYLKYVYDSYKLQLAGVAVTTMTLAPGDQLVKRVEAFFAGIGVSFNKCAIANRLCADINKMRSIDDLRGTRDRAVALIAAINSALEW